MSRINFKISELNRKIKNLESNGFTEYLNTWEKVTVDGELNMNHVIFIATKGDYKGCVCDIYYNEKTKVSWLEYHNTGSLFTWSFVPSIF